MPRVTETEQKKATALLVSQTRTPFSEGLTVAIQKYDITLTTSENIPTVFQSPEYLFLMKDSYTKAELEQVFSLKTTRVLFAVHTEKLFSYIQSLIQSNHGKNIKVVYVKFSDNHSDTIERALWFMLSGSSELSLRLVSMLAEHVPHRKKAGMFSLRFKLTKRRIFAATIFFVCLLHTFFLIPLAVTSWHTYTAAKRLQAGDVGGTQSSLVQAKRYKTLTQATYVLAEPGLKFLFISSFPRNIIAIHEDAITVIEIALKASSEAHELMNLIVNPLKSPEDIEHTRQLAASMQTSIISLQDTTQSVYDRLDYQYSYIQNLRRQMEEALTVLDTARVLSTHMQTILANNSTKHYVIFFYNNMELRPGGGFIGSFADVVIENYSLKTFNVYDVYDADGKLTTHVRPPKPIRDILDQPHWFLRDSNFDPDFPENVKTAEFFLEKELQLKDFDGAIGITTTALTYILEAFDEVYVPDFDDTITAENFYLKTQSQAENEFFPGSIQKKSFLSTVGRTLMLSAGKASPSKLASGIRQALDEKHIVLHMKNVALQRDIDRLGWNGQVVSPQCIQPGKNCIVNHILPVEANLGVNKANFFVNKLMKLSSHIDGEGTISNEFSVAFTNNSSLGIAPGGTYINYFQVYIPVDARIKSIDIDGTLVYDYEVTKNGVFKIAAYLLSVDPGETLIFTLTYDLDKKLLPGENIYQIVLQKQIGAFNSDFSLDISFDPHILLVDQNFKSVAKNHSVFYNSSLSTNKVFVTELIKQ